MRGPRQLPDVAPRRRIPLGAHQRRHLLAVNRPGRLEKSVEQQVFDVSWKPGAHEQRKRHPARHRDGRRHDRLALLEGARGTADERHRKQHHRGVIALQEQERDGAQRLVARARHGPDREQHVNHGDVLRAQHHEARGNGNAGRHGEHGEDRRRGHAEQAHHECCGCGSCGAVHCGRPGKRLRRIGDRRERHEREMPQPLVIGTAFAEHRERQPREVAP